MHPSGTDTSWPFLLQKSLSKTIKVACRREAVMHKVFQLVVVLVFISSVSCSRSLQQSPSPSPSPSAGDYINAGLNAIQSDPNGTAIALANCMLAT